MEKAFFYMVVFMIFVSFLTIFGMIKPNLKEECLTRGGTSVESSNGVFEKCIEPLTTSPS